MGNIRLFFLETAVYVVRLQHLVGDFFCKTQAAEYYLVNRKRLFQFSLLTGGHPRTDSFWNQDSCLSLIIFQDAAYNSSGCAHGGVKHVTVYNLQKMEHALCLFICVILSIKHNRLSPRLILREKKLFSRFSSQKAPININNS